MYKRKDKDKRMTTEELIKTALDELDQYQVRRYAQNLYNARRALYKALETPCEQEKEFVAWEQFYPDFGKPNRKE